MIDLALPAPEHVRAARALLAWSQADLARAANVAVSTVADFERGHRVPVTNNAQAMKEALENEGVKFLPGGAVIGAKMPAPVTPKPGKPMRWIEAHDLVQWGGTRDGQAMMPELISRLLIAAHGPAAALRFPSGDSIQHSGWDGICEVTTASTYVPAGKSVWEIGTQRTKIGQKAEEDYHKRTADPLGVDPAQTAFVFVTPQRWPQKSRWITEKKKDGVWKDVLAIDGDVLVHWLEMFPGVAEWLAVRVNRRPIGLRGLDAVWSEWSLATIPALSTDLITLDRDNEAAKILAWLYGPPSILSVQAEASDEAMAFVRGALAALPVDYRTYYETRILVAQSDEVARQLVGLGPKLAIILDGGDPGIAAALVQDGHHVLRALGSDVGSPIDVIQLARPWRHDITGALEVMGVEREDAHRLATASGRSLAVLRRLMTASPARSPSWATPPISPALLAAMLAGAWRDDHPMDRVILERLAGCSYDTLSATLTPLAAVFDGPVRRSGPVWKLASMRDSWLLLAPYLTDHHVGLLSDVFQQVLGDRDPAFDANLDDRWKIDQEPPKRASHELRRGVIEAMVALGVYPEKASGVRDAASVSGRNIRTLLDGADERLWWSLSDDFRLLSEAAPSAFFDMIDSALDRQPSPIAALFRSDEGFLHPQEYLSDLMWALEVHAWNPDLLATATLLLARLADIDPGGKVSNRPANSLRQIFLPWIPQTYATAEQRFQAIDLILKRYNRVGWKLLLAIAPTAHVGISHHSPTPLWRDYTVDVVEPVTRLGIARAYDAIGDRLLQHVGNDAARWSDLLDHWANFNDAWRETATEQLSASAGHFDVDAAMAFHEQLRGLIAKHEQFPDANWSMDAKTLAPLKVVFERLEPSMPTARLAWLFKRGDHHMRRDVPWREAERQLTERQREAAEQLVAVLSPAELVAYASNLDMPDALGAAIAALTIPDARKEEIADAAMREDSAPAANMARRMLFALKEQRGVAWLWARFDAAVAEGRPAREILPMMIALPVERATWDRIAAAGSEIERLYWGRIQTLWIPREEWHFACGKLLELDRGRSALEMLVGPPDSEASVEDILAVLRHPSTINVEKEDADRNDAVMFTYYVALAFKRLDADPSVAEEAILGLEWTYFHALQDSERPARLLHKAMSEHPGFFVDMLKAVFGSGQKVDRTDEAALERARVIASQAFHVLENWDRVPGTDEDGKIDGAALEHWVNEARRLCAEADLTDIGDSRIGQALSAAPRIHGEPWPPEPVREVIELCRSREVENGFQVGLFNRRGVTVRLPTDGGEQERALAEQYREDAAASAFTWPRTRALLERIAESYERDAQWEDQHAEQRDWT